MFFLHHGDLQDKVSPELYTECLCRAEKMLGMIEGIFQKGIGEGTFREVDTWMMALNLWATANGIFLLAKNKADHKFMKNFDEKMLLDHALDIFLLGLKKR